MTKTQHDKFIEALNEALEKSQLKTQKVTSAPFEEISEYVKSDDYVVRGRVARRQDLPAEVFEKLAADSEPQVVNAVRQNPATPEHVLRKLFVNDALALYFLIRNPSLPVDLVKEAVDCSALEEQSTIDIVDTLIERTTEYEGFPTEWVYAHLFGGNRG